MREFQTVIQKFLKNHEKHRKYVAFLTVLSLLVSFAVPFSLIMPAISMTNENGTEQGYFDTNQIANNINYVSNPPSSYSDALDISSSSGFYSEAFILNGVQEDSIPTPVKEDTLNNLIFRFNYEFSGSKGFASSYFPVEVDNEGNIISITGNRYMYLDISDVIKADFAFTDSSGDVIDSNYDNDVPAGEYRVEGNYVIIELTNDDYIKHLQGSTILGGSVEFTGNLSRKDDEDGDQKFKFGNEEITVQFEDKYPTISKNGWETNPNDGTITWEITVNNSAKSDLSQYTLTDTMFSSATDVEIEPSSAGSFLNGTFTFTQDSKNSDSIKITYKTPINEYNKNIKNDAKLKKDEYESPGSKDVWIDKAIDVVKTGKADYENGGTYNKQINWTIEITPKHGQSLDNYEIVDANFPSDLSNITVSPAGSLTTKDGKTILTGTTKGQKITLTYKANAEVGKDNKNDVTVTPPGGTPEPGGNTVHYNDKSDFYNLTKNGEYDPDTHLVKWTIKVSSTDNTSLNGYKLVDAGFANAVDGKFYTNWTENEFTNYNLSGSTMTLKGDSTNVEFYYYTKVTKEEASKKEVSNDVDLKDLKDDPLKDPDPTKVIVSEFRDTLYKSVKNHGDSNVDSTGTIKQDIEWSVNITYDDSLAGKTYKDILSVTGGNGATHTITQEQLNAMEVYAGIKSGNKEKLTLGTDYEVSLNGTEFTVTFKDTDKVKNSNYVDLTYKTTATAGSEFTKYEFKNSGSGFGDGTNNSGSHSITRGNPNVDNKTNIHISKNWNDNENKANERPNNIKVRVMYQTKTGNNGQLTEWKPLKGSGENYLFDGDSGYAGASEYTLTLTGSNWTADLSNLPMEKAIPDENGNKQDSTYYYYKIEEVEQNGKTITGGYFNTANGLYQVTNSYSSNQSNQNQNLNVTNTYYGNIDITAEKQWDGSAGSGDNVNNVTVKLMYSTNNYDSNSWKPVRKDSSGKYIFDDSSNAEIVTATLTKNNNNWKQTFSGLPSKIVTNNNSVLDCYYKIVETAVDGTAVDAKNKIVEKDNGYYEVSILESSNANTTSTLTVKNTFKKNVTIIPKKAWAGDALDGDITEIVVKLQRRIVNGAWEDVTGASNITLTAGKTWYPTQDDYSTWTNLPRKDANGNDYYYKAVEISAKTSTGKTIEIKDTDKTFITDKGYYEVSDSGDSNNATYWDDSQTLTVTNTFHKTENLTIEAKKIWNDKDINGVDYSNQRPDSIILQLQKSADYGEWQKVDEQTLSVSGDEQTYSWNNGLVSQTIDPETGKVTKYRYRVLEVGYVHNGISYRLPEGNTVTFATTDDGTYEGTYKVNQYTSGNELSESGTVEITNTFEPVKTIEITPQKKWVGTPLDSIKFRLQYKNGNEWEDYKDASGNIVEVDLKSNSETDQFEYDYENGQQVVSATIWQGSTVSNLPQKKISVTTDENGKTVCKSELCSYRFVEIVTENGQEKEIADGGNFKVPGGIYKVILGKEVSYTGNFLITNTYEKNVGITKHAYDSEGIELPLSIDKEEFNELKESGKLIKDSFEDENGKTDDYYVFNWMVKYDLEKWDTVNGDGLPTVKDHLPDDFTLCEDTSFLGSKPSSPGQKWGTYWYISGYQQSSGFDYLTKEKYKKDYIVQPSIVYPDVKYACGGMPAESINDIYENLMIYVNDKFNGNPDFWYYYDKANNDVYFNKYKATAESRVWYAIKIKCSLLEEKIEKGTYVIKNTAYTYNDSSQDEENRTPTGQTEGSLTIVNKVPSNLITKDYVGPSKVPGYINFALDINPDGKDLSNGDTIDIEDIFKTDSYFDSDWSDSKKIRPQLDTGTNLVDVLMNNIKVYKVDVNGNETRLSANDYQLQFDSESDGVNSKEGEKGAALLKLTIPDETHIRIEYQYKLIANENTPSVINGCISSTKVGKYYVPMAPGLVPPAGDKITFTNKASLYSDSASADDSVKHQEYEVSRSKGTIYANRLPKVKKVNTGNAEITDLQAKFLLAKYDQSSQKWLYATKITKGEKITEWSEGVTGLNVAEGAVKIDVNTGYSDEVSLEQDALYKLIEVEVPDGYEGSNLGLSSDEFEALIIDYLNGNIADTNVALYETFLNNFVNTHYFVYNSIMTSYPEGVDKNAVIQVKNGDDVKIPNNELIKLGVTKNWINDEGNKPDSKIDVRLYWSYTKASVGIPSDAKEVEADELGIMNEDFSSIKTVSSGSTENVWTDLPNGKNGKPIYYYIKETAYEIDGTKYTLVEDEKDTNYGKYMSEEGTEGIYMPTYIGNAANSNTKITVNNSQQLMLKKVWKTSSNNPLSESKIPTDEIIVSIYGIDKLGAKTEEPIFKDVVLTKEGKWQLDITGLLTPEIDLSQYKSFTVEESGFNTDDYVISCVFNLNENTGEITVTNKNINATEASVSVNKVWSDGDDVHKNESIKVTLYQSETEIKDVSKLTLEQLTSVGAKVMTKTNDEDTKIYKDVILNAENEWSYSWTGLPIDDGAEINPKTYYYYVLEDMSGIANADKYVASYSSAKSNNNTKIEYTVNNKRNSIVVQKQWFDEDGNEIVKYNEDGKLVDNEGNILAEDSDMYNNLEAEFNVYKKEALKIVAFGDSITDGYGDCSKNDKCYPSKLAKLLKNDVVNKGVSQQQIGNSSTDEFRGRVSSDIPSDTSIVCFLGGTNDIHQGGNGQGNPAEVYRRFEACIQEIQSQTKNNASIFVASIPHFDFYKNGSITEGGSWWPSQYQANDGKVANDLIDEYNAKIKEFANKTDGVYFVDVCSVVTDNDIRADGCHPNESGYEKIAKAFAEAINDNYTPPTDKIITSFTLNKANNWMDSVDIPKRDDNKDSYYEDSYYVREVTKTGWEVNYIDNSQKVASGNTITVENHKVSERTSINLEKIWSGDSPNDPARDGVKFMLLRSTTPDVEDSWEQYDIKTPEPIKTDDKWTYVFGVDAEEKPTLPTKDINGDTYYYKFEEYVLDGYNTTYGANESQGLISIDDGSAGILHITNTRQISLKIQKQWSDSDTNEHLMDTVKVQIFRSTNPNDVPDVIKNNLMLQVPESVSVGVGNNLEVIVNKTITSAVSDNENVTVSFDGNKLVITGGSEEGTSKITVSDGIEEKIINVTVSSLEILLNDERNYIITAGDEATLSVTKEGATFNVVSGNDVVEISGSTLTAKNVGTAVISATADGVTVEQTITVKYPNEFSFENSEVEVIKGETLEINPPDIYGGFEYTSIGSSNITYTINSDGKIVVDAKNADAGDTVTIKAKRGNFETTLTVNVVAGSITLTVSEAKAHNESNAIKFDKPVNSLTITINGSDWAAFENLCFSNGDSIKAGLYGAGGALCVESGTLNHTMLSGLIEGGVQGQYVKYDRAGANGTLTFNFDAPIESMWFTKLANEGNFTNIVYSVKFAPVNRSFAPNNTMTLMSDSEPVTLTGEPVGKPIEIKQSDDWTKTVTGLDVYDSNKQPYYYWAVETDTITGYTATYLFTDDDDDTSNCLNASQLGDGNIVIKNNKTVSEGVEMPSTGGEGTKSNEVTGMCIILGSAVSYIVIRRLIRRKRIR